MEYNQTALTQNTGCLIKIGMLALPRLDGKITMVQICVTSFMTVPLGDIHKLTSRDSDQKLASTHSFVKPQILSNENVRASIFYSCFQKTNNTYRLECAAPKRWSKYTTP